MGRYFKAFLFVLLAAGAIIGVMYFFSGFRIERPLPPTPSSDSSVSLEQRYLDKAASCRDSIDVWGDYRGTVPRDALALLKDLKSREADLGHQSVRHDESSRLAVALVSKMESAKEKWEIAGDDQKTVDSGRAQACYQLSLELAEAIESVRRDILGMEDGGMSEEVGRIRNKIDRLN